MQILSEQEVLRREKLNQLRELGIEPYPAALYPVTHYANEIKEINTKILDILPKNLTELQEFENISEGEEKHLIAMISEVKYLVSWVNNEIKQKLGL